MLNIIQPKIEDFKKTSIDFFIVASGYESRARTQAEKYAIQAKNKIALGFSSEKDDIIRKQNDKILSKLGFSISIINGEESTNIKLFKIIKEIEKYALGQGHTNILIDYSSMTRNWYSYLIYGLISIKNKCKISIYLGYSHAAYVPYDGHQTLNRIVAPLFGYCDLNVPNKPTALIIGLGNEPNRIYGLKQYFDAVQYIFYTDKSYNEKYSKEIEKLNSEILNETNPRNVFKFPIHDLIYTNYILKNLCHTLLKDFRVVIAPCGPKPFALLAMINALSINDTIEVWRISPGHKIGKVDRKPTGLISLIKID